MAKRKEISNDFDLFGGDATPSRRKRTLAPANPAAGGPSGPAMSGGPSGPAMSGGPSGPAMSGGPSGPAMSGGKASAPAKRKRSMDDDTFKSLF